MNKSLLNLTTNSYRRLICAASSLQPIFLLVIRLYWGWQFFMAGKGKLGDIDKVAGFFHNLGIPWPTLNAYLAGSAECFCGLFLLLGFASRLATLPLIFTMLIAYLTAENEALRSIFSDPDKFTAATPFLFLLTVVIIFLFGPGPISVDGLLKKFFACGPCNSTTTDPQSK
ncbi:MAG: DoxX family protein [Methylacidiphilales bacterium]|nr:DoxX family protein [Candidatus Methylacidiphilales bacterium]